ncbi:DUF485 domain-containing protein [Paraburkholderia unamae]|nr:DUF485 domain-containing protein [Paraburkholderia unamae]RAR54234.1 uncharacterized protein DUF485 [Paraburkholderia unamae]
MNPLPETLAKRTPTMDTAGIPLCASSSDRDEHTGLGITLTVIQVAVFFTFISLCTFHPALLEKDVFDIGIPLSFLSGLAVIACGIVLTAVYVGVANSGAGE